MIFARLTQRWHALRYWRERQSLSRLPLARRLAATPGDDPIPRLVRQASEGDYLARGLGAHERVRCVVSHYRFEDATFGAAYQQAVYGDENGGVDLWRHAGDDGEFALRLGASARDDAAGELTIALLADGQVLHRLSWTWADGALFGAGLPVVPFLTRNEGRWSDSGDAFDAFERAFPNNSPSFFCFAALQGAAQALGIDRVAAVRAAAHLDFAQDQLQAFENAYDGFWRILGGAERDARSYLIPLPFYLKPLQDMPSKHRKRAALRREQWRAIGDASRSAVLRHLAPAAAGRAVAAAAASTAEA